MTDQRISATLPTSPAPNGWYLIGSPAGGHTRYWVEPFDRGDPMPWLGLHRESETRHDPKLSIGYVSIEAFADMAPIPEILA